MVVAYSKSENLFIILWEMKIRINYSPKYSIIHHTNPSYRHHPSKIREWLTKKESKNCNQLEGFNSTLIDLPFDRNAHGKK